MVTMTTIFAKILRGEIPSSKVYEDDLVYAFDDVSPVAPVHVLVIPRRPLVNLNDASDDAEAVLGRLLHVCKRVAEIKGIAAAGYRVVLNTNDDSGQSVYHLHAHVIGGRSLSWPPG
jgi:histidine triad (HIT) family protein